MPHQEGCEVLTQGQHTGPVVQQIKIMHEVVSQATVSSVVQQLCHAQKFAPFIMMSVGFCV